MQLPHVLRSLRPMVLICIHVYLFAAQFYRLYRPFQSVASSGPVLGSYTHPAYNRPVDQCTCFSSRHHLDDDAWHTSGPLSAFRKPARRNCKCTRCISHDYTTCCLSNAPGQLGAGARPGITLKPPLVRAGPH